MARRSSEHPTDAELAILQALWREGPTSLGKIHAALAEKRPVAKTTIATMLKIMLEKGLVHRADGERGYVWSAAVTHKEAASGMVGKLVDHVFEGSAMRMVAHMVEGGRLSEEELEEIWRLRKKLRQQKNRKKE